MLNNEFEKFTDYCVAERKRISVLVKPFLNHSPTHIFLVWSVIRALKKNFKGIKNLREPKTVDADIIFEYEGKTYALEIETGDLIWKKDQLDGKIRYLNRKYSKKRWMFIVSHRNLVKKYKKYGNVTTRSQVLEKVKKMLKN